MPHRRFRLILAAIVVAGLGGALLVFVLAELPSGNPLGEPGDSKMYVHDMLLYGGKTNMVLGEFAQWFASLWHGRRLALSIAVLTLVLAAAFYYFFVPLPDPDADAPGEREDERDAA
jgi:hypothetical protein